MFSLNGKIALVTGAGSGIGASIAQVFAKAGAQVVVTDIKTDGADSAVAQIRSAGGHAVAMTVDVSDEQSVQRIADKFYAAHPHLDILVNNAGIGHVGTVTQTTAADLDRLYSVNVRGVFNMTKAFLPRMLE